MHTCTRNIIATLTWSSGGERAASNQLLVWGDPWRRKQQPTPVFLPGKSHGQRSLVGYSPWGRKRVGYNLVTQQTKNRDNGGAQEDGFPWGSVGKESTWNAGDLGLIPGLGRSLGEGKGYLLQYSGLENSMDFVVHGIAKNRT